MLFQHILESLHTSSFIHILSSFSSLLSSLFPLPSPLSSLSVCLSLLPSLSELVLRVGKHVRTVKLSTTTTSRSLPGVLHPIQCLTSAHRWPQIRQYVMKLWGTGLSIRAPSFHLYSHAPPLPDLKLHQTLPRRLLWGRSTCPVGYFFELQAFQLKTHT